MAQTKISVRNSHDWRVYMIPFVTAGGILIALSFLIGGYQVESGPSPVI